MQKHTKTHRISTQD